MNRCLQRLHLRRDRVDLTRNWPVYLPFRIYLGWITVATIANITWRLYFLGWGGERISPSPAKRPGSF